MYVLAVDADTGDISGVHSVVDGLPLANAYGLHRHAASGSLLVLYAGDRRDMPGGVQRLVETDDGVVLGAY